MLPDGKYVMVKPSLGVGVEKSGTEFLWITGTITHGKDGDEYVKLEEEREATVKLYLSHAAMPHSRKDLEQLGFNGDFENPTLSEEFMRRIPVFLANGEYKGKPQERWSLRDPSGSKRDTIPADNDTKKKLSERYRKPATPPANDDDIPF